MIWGICVRTIASHGVKRRGSAEKPQLGVLIFTGEQHLSAGYHNVSTSQAQSDLAEAIMKRKGAAEGDRERQGRRIKKSY